MCLYPSSVRDEVRTDTPHKLDQAAALCDNSSDWTIEWLITQFLIVIKAALETALINDVRSRWSREQLGLMKVHNFFTVPEITTFTTRIAFQDIVRSAGFESSTLVTETEAAAAWRVHQLSKDWHNYPYLVPGAKIVIADGGGLTLNAARYTIDGSAQDGAALKMHPDGSPVGTDCGSELLTMRCQDHVRTVAADQYGHLDACLHKFGISKEEFDRSVAMSFEPLKKEFPEVGSSVISVGGILRENGELEFLDVRVSKRLFLTWFKETLDRIITVLDQLIEPGTTMLLFTGGLLRNPYLVNGLKSVYSDRGIHMPDSATTVSNASDTSVVKGALARFIVRPIQADRTLCLGINEKSPYNPDNHVDILLHEVTAAEAGTPSDRVTKLDGQLYALDRFRTILAPDAFVGSRNLDEAVGVWQEFSVTIEKPTLETAVYETRTGNPDNGPIFKTNLDFQDDIRVYRHVKRTIDEATMKQYQHRLPHGASGARHYRVVARLRARGTWPNEHLELVLGPGKGVLRARREFDTADLAKLSEDRMTQLGTDELHNGLFPSTLQRNRHHTPAAHVPATPMAPLIMTPQQSVAEPTPEIRSVASSPLFMPQDSPLASRAASDRVLEQFETDEESDTGDPGPSNNGEHNLSTSETARMFEEHDASSTDQQKKRRKRVEEPETTNYEGLARPGKLPRVPPRSNGLPRVKTLMPKNLRKDVYDGP